MIIEYKICNRCKKRKPVTQFYQRKGGDGYHSSCRECERAKAKGRWANLKANQHKVTGKISMIAGENEIFTFAAAKNLIGQTTRDGWNIVDAKYMSNHLIWLTVEKVLDPNESKLITPLIWKGKS